VRNITCVLQVTTLSYSFWANKTGNAGEGMLEKVLSLPGHVRGELVCGTGRQGGMLPLGENHVLVPPDEDLIFGGK
jgi:hypothetical protein